MCRRRERASADRRVRSGSACSLVPAEQNGERRRTAPAKQLRQWRGVRNFSPEGPPCCVFECSTLATLSHQKQEGEGLTPLRSRRGLPLYPRLRKFFGIASEQAKRAGTGHLASGLQCTAGSHDTSMLELSPARQRLLPRRTMRCTALTS